MANLNPVQPEVLKRRPPSVNSSADREPTPQWEPEKEEWIHSPVYVRPEESKVFTPRSIPHRVATTMGVFFIIFGLLGCF